MNDFEQRLAAALHESVADARPPDRLMDLIGRRHRRYRIRVGAVTVTAIAAIALAVPLAMPTLTGGRPPATGPLPSSASQSPRPRVPGHEPRSISLSCADQIAGQYAKDWRRHSIHAGPAWLINVQPAGASTDGSSPLPFGNLPVNVKDGAHIRITVAGAARSYFRFLFGTAGTGGRYTLGDGQLSAAFTSCRPGHDLGIYPGYTEFWGGFVIAKVPACVSLDVWADAGHRPARITFAVGAIRCSRAPEREGSPLSARRPFQFNPWAWAAARYRATATID
ncbi:MAG: hypothetical protein LBI49_24385 [Nocardiopsaceae bacterium]|nr:hypothetical protein [Nocardiopsaceae bacterium]